MGEGKVEPPKDDKHKDKAADTKAGGAVPAGDPAWATGVDTFRSTITWVVVTFGAIGALIAGTSPLAGIGGIEGKHIAYAVFGAAIALAGALVAVLSAVRVLMPVAVYPGHLRPRRRGGLARVFVRWAHLENEIHEHPETFLPIGVTTIDDLTAGIRNAGSLCARLALDVGEATTDEARKSATERLAFAQSHLDQYEASLRNVLGLARFEQARTRFNQSLAAMSIGALAAAIGIGATLYGINKPPEHKDAAATSTVTAPAAVHVHLSADGVATLGSSLGAHCVTHSIAAVLMSGDVTKPPWDVLVTASADCTLARVTLTEGLGTLSAG